MSQESQDSPKFAFRRAADSPKSSSFIPDDLVDSPPSTPPEAASNHQEQHEAAAGINLLCMDDELRARAAADPELAAHLKLVEADKRMILEKIIRATFGDISALNDDKPATASDDDVEKVDDEKAQMDKRIAEMYDLIFVQARKDDSEEIFQKILKEVEDEVDQEWEEMMRNPISLDKLAEDSDDDDVKPKGKRKRAAAKRKPSRKRKAAPSALEKAHLALNDCKARFEESRAFKLPAARNKTAKITTSSTSSSKMVIKTPTYQGVARAKTSSSSEIAINNGNVVPRWRKNENGSPMFLCRTNPRFEMIKDRLRNHPTAPSRIYATPQIDKWLNNSSAKLSSDKSVRSNKAVAGNSVHNLSDDDDLASLPLSKAGYFDPDSMTAGLLRIKALNGDDDKSPPTVSTLSNNRGSAESPSDSPKFLITQKKPGKNPLKLTKNSRAIALGGKMSKSPTMNSGATKSSSNIGDSLKVHPPGLSSATTSSGNDRTRIPAQASILKPRRDEPYPEVSPIENPFSTSTPMPRSTTIRFTSPLPPKRSNNNPMPWLFDDEESSDSSIDSNALLEDAGGEQYVYYNEKIKGKFCCSGGNTSDNYQSSREYNYDRQSSFTYSGKHRDYEERNDYQSRVRYCNENRSSSNESRGCYYAPPPTSTTSNMMMQRSSSSVLQPPSSEMAEANNNALALSSMVPPDNHIASFLQGFKFNSNTEVNYKISMTVKSAK